jgi:hypothetical protein
MRPDDVYPRFGAVERGFRENFALFEKFVESVDIGELILLSYELTYINHIERTGRLKNLRYASSLFPDLRWRSPTKRYLPTPSHLTWSVGFEFNGKGRLVADLKPAQRYLDNQEIFVLELKATGDATAADNADANAWFQQAHEWIVRGFADLTSERSQEALWGLERPDA